MPDLPRLPMIPIIDYCPDAECRAAIGMPHEAGCTVAICLSNGQQRVIHEDADILPPTPGQPEGVTLHMCGTDLWAGVPRGTLEAITHELWVRPAGLTDPDGSGWVPCEAEDPAAVPDIARVVASGIWNPITQQWELGAREVRTDV